MRARILSLWHPTFAVVAAILLVWWMLPRLVTIPLYLFPTLESVVSNFATLLADGTLLRHTVASLTRFVIALGIGISLGVAVGLAVASSRAVVRFFEPLLIFTQSIAGIAWLPLAVIWFGIGEAPLLFVVINAAFFLVLANTAIGVQTVPPLLKQAARTLGASPRQVYTQVVLPGALASIVVGVRLAFGFGWKSLVAAEILVANDGLGYLAMFSADRFETATILVSIVTIGALGFAMDQLLLRPLEARTIERWGVVRTP